MELRQFELQVVHRMPNELNQGTLYVCFDCNVVAHLCACGCGEKVILPIDPDFWSIKYDGETVSLTPSIGNFQFPCKSHYWIKENRIVWAEPTVSMSTTKTKSPRKKKCWLDRLKAFF